MRLFKYVKYFDDYNKLMEFHIVPELQYIKVRKEEYKHNGMFYAPVSTETKHYHFIKDDNELSGLLTELERQGYKKKEI